MDMLQYNAFGRLKRLHITLLQGVQVPTTTTHPSFQFFSDSQDAFRVDFFLLLDSILSILNYEFEFRRLFLPSLNVSKQS